MDTNVHHELSCFKVLNENEFMEFLCEKQEHKRHIVHVVMMDAWRWFFPVCVCGKTPKAKVLTKKPILPSGDELAKNPRSASAKLRLIEKV